MFKFTFEQKFGMGFAIIIFLLVVSGASSLFFLERIENSSRRVTGTAVPVVKGSNEVQIQLLKLAKLSSLAFNRVSKSAVMEDRAEFNAGDEKFRALFESLQNTTEDRPDMAALVKDVEKEHFVYTDEVRAMLSAKLGFLRASDKVTEEAKVLNGLVDNVGGALENIAYAVNIPEDFRDRMKEVEGNASYANQLLLSAVKTIREVRDTNNPERLETAIEDLKFAIRDSRFRLGAAARDFEEVDEDDLIPKANASYDALLQRVTAEENLVSFKREELSSMALAQEKLKSADAAVSSAITHLDGLVALADHQFSQLQSNVFDTLSFGFKSTLGILAVLILMAIQNFNSMRKAIRQKMRDLAQLNRLGQGLASAQHRDTALEEVLRIMQEKIGVAQGSVFLSTDEGGLELAAFFPPMEEEEGHEPAKFVMGQGVLGRAAETHETIFVPDTLQDNHYQAEEGEQARSLLCIPLIDKEALLGVINLSGDVRKVSFADSDYEFVASAAQSLVTTIKNIHMRETIEEYNRTLEDKVRERTADLQQKNRDIASMMANMQQGLFTITPGGSIHPEYSAYLESIFETERVASRQFSDFMFNKARLSSDEIDQCIAAVDTIVGEDSIMFEFNSHCLPGEMTIRFEDDRQKMLEMDWDPILNEQDEVEKLMVAVRDVTELRALEVEAAWQRRELEIIGEILGVEADKFREFMDISVEFIDQCQALIEQTPEKDLQVIATLFRNMHTVKGNARTYGLSLIAEKVHQVEQTYDNLRNDDDMPWYPSQLLGELEELREVFDHYGQIFGEKLGRDTSSGSGLGIDQGRIGALLEEIRQVDVCEASGQVQKLMGNIYRTLAEVEARPLSALVHDVAASTRSLASDLNKAEPRIDIDDGGIVIKHKVHATLNNIFMHLFRNAMDHGIEAPDERRAKHKPEAGQINVGVSANEREIVIAVREDGRGLALGRIFEKACQKGLYAEDEAPPPPAEIANLIFSSGFSTAEQVSAVSGRGVGMDAVREFLQSMGGDVEIVLDPGDEQGDFRPFTTRILLPKEYAFVIPSFAADKTDVFSSSAD